jgi:transposase InsO family protein
MIDKEHDLSIVKQAKILGLSRSGVYYEPRPVSDADLALMRRMDELHLSYPFAGSRMLAGLLRGEGHKVGRLHVRTLMRKMGLSALCRRPNTTKRDTRSNALRAVGCTLGCTIFKTSHHSDRCFDKSLSGANFLSL